MKRTRAACFAFLVFIAQIWNGYVVEAQTNVTVDDDDSRISYSPSSSWHSSNLPCSTCLDPQDGGGLTWHDGTHVIPTEDNDDKTTTSASAVSISTHASASSKSVVPSSSPSSVPPVTSSTNVDNDNDGDDVDNPTGIDTDKGGKDDIVLEDDDDPSDPFNVSKLDSDDPGFVDTSVTMQFNFTGTAIYVFGILPLGAAPANTTPTNTNLTFVLDGAVASTFRHNGSESDSGFLPDMIVFARGNLSNQPHTLTAQVGDNSVFLFDYLLYTQSEELDSSSSSASTNDVGSTPTNSKHDVASWAGAVGGSFGVLSVLALAIALSLCIRRRRATKRDLEGNSSRENVVSRASAFRPRYFPGTADPNYPPPYVPPPSLRRAPSMDTLNGLSMSTVAYEPVTVGSRSPAPAPSPPTLTLTDIPVTTPQLLSNDDDHIHGSIPPPSFNESANDPRLVLAGVSRAPPPDRPWETWRGALSHAAVVYSPVESTSPVFGSLELESDEEDSGVTFTAGSTSSRSSTNLAQSQAHTGIRSRSGTITPGRGH